MIHKKHNNLTETTPPLEKTQQKNTNPTEKTAPPKKKPLRAAVFKPVFSKLCVGPSKR
jgi:hypothetical protein